MSKFKRILLAALLLLIIGVWWEFLDSRSPSSADEALPLAEMQELVAITPTDTLPHRIGVITVGRQTAPKFAVEAGGGFGKFNVSFTAFNVDYGDRNVVIDAAVDKETGLKKSKGDAGGFSPSAYQILTKKLAAADHIILTHEHDDHASGLLAQASLPTLLQHTYLPASQKSGLLRLATENSAKVLEAASWATPKIQQIAPGIVVAPAPGHSPGTQIILVRLKSGKDYLFVGDISWSKSGIKRLKTRPRILQWIMFDPNEDRPVILRQLRALHDLSNQSPAPVIVPSHDGDYLDSLVEQGLLRNDSAVN